MMQILFFYGEDRITENISVLANPTQVHFQEYNHINKVYCDSEKKKVYKSHSWTKHCTADHQNCVGLFSAVVCK